MDNELKEIAESLCPSEAWDIWVNVSGKNTACTDFAGDTESLDKDSQKFCTTCLFHETEHNRRN